MDKIPDLDWEYYHVRIFFGKQKTLIQYLPISGPVGGTTLGRTEPWPDVQLAKQRDLSLQQVVETNVFGR